ncbi:MAG: hypothetical protein N3F08_06585 [Crenarchaeota archaeon]|nr:hypothetical protein [Thermoproteota archaeon]
MTQLINPDASVFARMLVASIEQRIMLEKALGQVKVEYSYMLNVFLGFTCIVLRYYNGLFEYSSSLQR